MRLGGMGEDDLGSFNRWLCLTRIRAAIGMGACSGVLAVVAPDELHFAPLVPVFVVAALGSLVGLRSRTLARRPRLLFGLQAVLDTALVAVGLGTVVHGTLALLLRPLFAIVVIPPSLLSVPWGLAVVVAASIAHLVLLALDQGVAACWSVGGIVPPLAFALTAQHCFFYGRHLAAKNRALRALVEVARTLAATLEAPELLGRVTATLLRTLDADWVGTFLLDPVRDTFRLVACNGPDVDLRQLGGVDFPVAAWPEVRGLAQAPIVRLAAGPAARVPTALTAGERLHEAILAPLRREATVAGFVAVGWRRRRGRSRATLGGLLADVAEHAAIALRNAELLEQVRLASALKSEFVGAVSHELRSPLNVILGYTEMLREGGLGPVAPEQAKALERTHRQALVLHEMITALLDLNRLDAGRLPVEVAPVAVDVLVRELLEQVPDEWHPDGVALGAELEPGLPLLATDAAKLKTVLRNLLHNALKFTDAGQVVLTARRMRDGGVALAVRDTGRGIPADALPYVFDMFRQVPGMGGGGVGLGLHIVRRFVHALGGTVEVTSTLGVGTCFTVTMPCAPATLMADVA